MIKNVTILDVQGNIIGMTYPRRAKGLVKSGRACFVDGKTVQLACPSGRLMPKQQEGMNMEMTGNREPDNSMPEMIQEKATESILQKTEDAQQEVAAGQKADSVLWKDKKAEQGDILKEETAESEAENLSEKAKKFTDAGITLKDILHSLDAIRQDCGYMNKALDDLEKLPYTAPNGVPDLAGQARAEAISDIVKCRETTNQMMIKLYTQIYTDYMEK